MTEPICRFRKIKYAGKDSADSLFSDLKKKKDLYFAVNRISKYGNTPLLLKALTLLCISVVAYFFILISEYYLLLQLSYLLLGTSWVVMGMNLGHDAAHHCLTGNRKADNTIFEIIFGLQGISGYLWKLRHNNSHHPFPNIYAYDSDLEITNLFFLNPNQRKKKIHYYQHLYAPVLYMFISLLWIFHTDFMLFRKKKLANMDFINHPGVELIKLILFKITSITFFLVLPLLLSPLPALFVLLAFIVMHLLLSMVLTFIFFISHHVSETRYSSATGGILHTSWVEQQVAVTLDFHAESKVANFIFGGFNAHLAHHIFPDVCHIHYPVLSTLIKQTLRQHNVKYNSLSFIKAVQSHIMHLKNLPRNHIA
jgi:linoleoyl-CoA desaturase